MLRSHKEYVPAANRDWLLPLYDPLANLLGTGRARNALLDQVGIDPGDHILDIGCGTGTLAVQIKQHHPDMEVVGLDPDPKALARARRKAERAGVTVRFDQGFSSRLPYPDASFERVLSTFMLHHLHGDEKAATMREVRRVLKPGGVFGLLDFGEPEAGTGSLLARLFPFRHHFRNTSPSQVLSLMRQAGLAHPQMVRQNTLLAGSVYLNYFLAHAPAPEMVTP